MADALDWMRQEPRKPVDLHIDRPHAARIYDVLLGGKTNYPADREAAETLARNLPSAVLIAQENRGFMHRAVRYLAAEAGIRQFLDVGTGIPTSPNLHEVVQEVAPEARVVYADNDPIVLAHSRALHVGTAEGRTAYIEADVRRPETILESAELAEVLDLDQPVALTMCALLHWLPSDETYRIVDRLVSALPVGSYLALTYATNDFDEQSMKRVEGDLQSAGGVLTRSREEIVRYFDGLEMVPPGVVVPQHWRPDATPSVGDTDVALYVGMARKNN